MNIFSSFKEIGKLYVSGEIDKVTELIKQYLILYPEDKETITLLGVINFDAKNYNVAYELFLQAVSLDDKNALYWNNLGAVLREQRKPKEAILCFEKAIKFNEHYSEAAYNIGSSYQLLGELSLAEQWYDYAIVKNPKSHLSYNNLGNVYKNQGRIEEALCAFSKAIHYGTDPIYNSNYLFCLNYLEKSSRKSVFDKHVKLVKRGSTPLYSMNNIDYKSKHRLRVGYVSADFRTHSVAFFLYPIFRKRNVETFCYYNHPKSDKVTTLLRDNSDHWRDIYSLSDYKVFQMIKDDNIDILVDLSGHSGGNRLNLFSMKPASIQVSYLGYPNTTGLKEMDYRITDEFTDPTGISDKFYTEKLVRMPTFLCYNPMVENLYNEEPPCLRKRYITFGCFNNRAKINDTTIKIWSKLLLSIPYSKLILKSSISFDKRVKEELIFLFMKNGVDASRIKILPYLTLQEHIESYSLIDISLDTFPYNGTTTTLESLYSGVPVISLMGDRHASRVGASILSQLGLENWIIPSKDKYIKISKNLTDVNNLIFLRKTLREKIKGSLLMNETVFVSRLEEEYNKMQTNLSRS